MNIKNEIKKLLQSAGVEGDIKITTPPRSEMGDLSFAVFGTTAHQGLRQIGELVGKMNKIKNDNGFNFIDKIAQAGHYINFFLNPKTLAKNVLSAVDKKDFGRSKSGKGQKIMVEFAHPNTHKAFHIGHLRNITTGESMSRIFENAGYKVVRANYQGDVGLHIAKCMWGIARTMDEYEATKKKSAEEKAKFLGRVYALGGQAYEKDEQTKEEIVDLNEKIYAGGDKELNKIYKETRQWSLDYFEIIYKRVGTHFDRLYFESEVFEQGIEIVKKFLNLADDILLGGALANTVLRAKGIAIGKSIVEEEMVQDVKNLEITNTKIHIPVDTVVSVDKGGKEESREAPVGKMEENELILDIGPETENLFSQVIKNAKTIIWNGPVGLFEIEKFAHGTEAVARAVANCQCYSIVGGGETICYINKLGLADKFSHISTGGGAMLKFMAGEKLPGIEALNSDSNIAN